jgi:hypothetical protein
VVEVIVSNTGDVDMLRLGQQLVRWVLVLALLAPAAGPKAGVVGAEDNRSLPFLVAEDFEDLDFCAWRLEPAQPDPNNPLVEPAMPWDAGGVLAHGSVLRDPIDGVWKVWQHSIPVPAGKPDKQDSRWWAPRLTYLESKDGVHWERPRLKLVPWKGHPETNLLLEGYNSYASVNIDPARKDAPYEMFAFRNPGRLGETAVIEGLPLPLGKDKHPYGLYRFRSSDGKAWKAVEGPIALDTSDSCNIYRLADGSYVSYHKIGMPAFPGGLTPFDVGDGEIRLIVRRISKDGSKWSNPPAIVMAPDWRDPADTQFMELCPLPVPGGYVATLTVFHNLTQTIDLQWAASRDGINWWRPERRPCLANAALGDYGGGMIWPMQKPLLDSGRLYVYYGGTEGLHGDLYNTKASGPRVLRARGEILSRQSFTYGGDYGALCRAFWTADRLWALCGAHGGYTEGAATTRKTDLAGKRLLLNARSRPNGSLRVELLDASSRILPGFAAADCEPIAGDHHALAVRWKGGDHAPEGAARTRFLFRRAFLYGMAWQK